MSPVQRDRRGVARALPGLRWRAREAARHAMRQAARIRDGMDADDQPDTDDVDSMFSWLRERQRAAGGAWRASYAWPVLWGARTALALGHERVSVLEFGVAGGNGLIALEALAEATESLLDIGVSVYGFDTGSGNPKPADPRDAPFLHTEGDFPMDEDELRARLRRSSLLIGDVGETVTEFVAQQPAPIGFAAFDLDYYTSTVDAFAVLDADADRLLPRFICSFPTAGHPPWSDSIGEGAAIAEFNETRERRRLAEVRNLRFSLPRSEFRAAWPETLRMAEIFDHERYADPQGFRLADIGLHD